MIIPIFRFIHPAPMCGAELSGIQRRAWGLQVRSAGLAGNRGTGGHLPAELWRRRQRRRPGTRESGGDAGRRLPTGRSRAGRRTRRDASRSLGEAWPCDPRARPVMSHGGRAVPARLRLRPPPTGVCTSHRCACRCLSFHVSREPEKQDAETEECLGL